MATAVTSALENLCTKEFELAVNECYDGLDREAQQIRYSLAARGQALSSVAGQQVLDCVLSRYDRVLAAFEKTYWGKWTDPDRELTNSDYEWLREKAISILPAQANEAQRRCQIACYDASLSLQAFWQRAGAEAMERNNKVYKKLEILKLQKEQRPTSKAATKASHGSHDSSPDIWNLLHPKVVEVARTRFESRHYADAAEAAFKEVNEVVRRLVKKQTGRELDGATLMQHAFSPNKPILTLDDLGTESGRNIQLGYMQIFAGAMTGIRNPKAHSNIAIDAKRSIHFLFLASLLLFKLDERVQ